MEPHDSLEVENADTTTRSPENDHNKRKQNKKPLIEKQRRDRINNSLDQLKKLVLHALNKEKAHFSKLEKADILELTVKHLTELAHQQVPGIMMHDIDFRHKYTTGFNECANEVLRYVNSQQDLSEAAKKNLMDHLSGCLVLQVPMFIPEPPLTALPPQPAIPGVLAHPVPACHFHNGSHYMPLAAHPSAPGGFPVTSVTSALVRPILHVPRFAESTMVPRLPTTTPVGSSIEDVEVTDCSARSSSSSSTPTLSVSTAEGVGSSTFHSHPPLSSAFQDTRPGFATSPWDLSKRGAPSCTKSSSRLHTARTSSLPYLDYRQKSGTHSEDWTNSASSSDSSSPVSYNTEPVWRPW
ncbi:hypothetical protein ACOMHN_010557 [Nucella lapillus]